MMFPVKTLQITDVVNQLRNMCMVTGRKPKHLYADNAFDSKTLQDFCSPNDIELSFRVANLSRSNTVEATHRPFHAKISSLLGEKSASKWHTVAWKAAMSLNCQPHSIVGFAPHYLFHGRHPEYFGTEGIPDTIQYDETWLRDLQLAEHLTNQQRQKQASDYTYQTFPAGTELVVRPDNSKNARDMHGTVVEDNGGSSLLIKLDGRANPIPYHKGMLRAVKNSEAWKIMEQKKASKTVNWAETENIDASVESEATDIETTGTKSTNSPTIFTETVVEQAASEPERVPVEPETEENLDTTPITPPVPAPRRSRRISERNISNQSAIQTTPTDKKPAPTRSGVFGLLRPLAMNALILGAKCLDLSLKV